MRQKTIPDIVIGRLPLYLRALHRMAQDKRQVTSSQELGEKLGISAAQIRKDLSLFGEFGKQGTGYNIEYLVNTLKHILKVDRAWNFAVVGAGEIGSAVACYQGFPNWGYHISYIFDADPKRIGQKIGDMVIQDSKEMIELIRNSNIKLAIITVPASHAQEVADNLVKAGIQAILNYAPISLSVPPGVRVQNVDPVTHLQRMTFYLD